VRARSHASRQAIVQGALALWRTKGFAETSVTDICKAAGVSKALFYVYFSRKEDVLLELETFTMTDAHLAAQDVVARDYDLPELVAGVVGVLERRCRSFPAELIFEAVLETYRLERRALQDGATEADLAFLFLEPFTQARRDGKLPAGLDVPHAARLAQVLVADAFRSWSAARFHPDPLAPAIAPEIARIVTALG
jgi:AcrR family transcriptional regulator